MNIAITGNLDKKTIKHNICKILKPGYTLYAGTKCNDGRPITESWRYKQATKLGIPIIHTSPETHESKDMFVDKYAPKSISDIIGHKEQITQIHIWLQNWPNEKRAIIVTGPPGI